MLQRRVIYYIGIIVCFRNHSFWIECNGTDLFLPIHSQDQKLGGTIVSFNCNNHAPHSLRDFNDDWWFLRKPKQNHYPTKFVYYIYIFSKPQNNDAVCHHAHRKLSVNQLATTDSRNQLIRTKHTNSHMFHIRRVLVKQQICSGSEAFETIEVAYCSQIKKNVLRVNYEMESKLSLKCFEGWKYKHPCS